MKVIISLPKHSAFSHLNMLTFDVNMFVGDKLVNISIDDKSTADFSFKEVIIIDLLNELPQALKNDDVKKLSFIYKFIGFHKLNINSLLNKI